jgi:hypothetical protein
MDASLSSSFATISDRGMHAYMETSEGSGFFSKLPIICL